MIFVGLVDTNEKDSDIIDFGIIIQCQHVIVSHGTFGLWAALLSANGTNVMPRTTSTYNGQSIILSESAALTSSKYEEWFTYL